ncbi:MAG: hypothetical protein J6K22_08680 [Spirochaetaceae bacterium]|nr:hypothetical protein [Spirochaetaceae bacterium]
MKKICLVLLILLSILGFSVFVSCSNDSNAVIQSERFIGKWIQDSLENEIVITESGVFTVNSLDEGFTSATGTFVATATGANVSIDGIEEVFQLTFIEKDVFKIELPLEMGGEIFFIKSRDGKFNLNGTWKNSDKSITTVMNDVNNSLVFRISVDDIIISINGNFEKENNAFIMFTEDIDDEYLFQEIGSGVISASGKAYVFCMDAKGKWSSTVLTKSGE